MVAEDWDLHLLESYVIALQIAQRKDHIVIVIDIIRKVALLLEETGRFDQSFFTRSKLLVNFCAPRTCGARTKGSIKPHYTGGHREQSVDD